MLQECGYDQITISATDQAYQGLPSTTPARTVSVTLRNQAKTHIRPSSAVPKTG